MALNISGVKLLPEKEKDHSILNRLKKKGCHSFLNGVSILFFYIFLRFFKKAFILFVKFRINFVKE